MDKCGYGIAIYMGDDTNSVSYVAYVKKDSMGYYYGYLSPYIEDAKEFQFVKTCKDICSDIVQLMPNYQAYYFKFQNKE